MTDVDVKDSVCVVIITESNSTGFKSWIFGIYESEKLAKKRVKELGWSLPAEVLINYHTDLVWKEDSGTDA